MLAYRNSGNPANTALLVEAEFKKVKPETVSSYEIGYKGIIEKKLFVDAYVYYSTYRDFLATIGVGQSNQVTPAQTDLFSPFTTGNVSYKQKYQRSRLKRLDGALVSNTSSSRIILYTETYTQMN
ncbi:MAG: TonB-dependent receptor [Bacteroidota bacterium]